ncbi:MAG: Crp/Fnr family transcriptional regulator [Bacteroidales bacterium]|nr:Crp/Fnr family transcriptional regulator [Bacteroidales bacterium]
MLEIILRNPMFRGISLSDVATLFENGHYQIKHYQTNDVVGMQGEPCNHLMIVLKGEVQAQMIEHTGKLIVMAEISAPHAYAAAFIYAEQNEFPVTVVAQKESEILFVRKEIFIEMLQKNRVLLQNFLTFISNRSKFLTDKIHFLTFRTIKSKIADFLLKRRIGDNLVVMLDETQQELADMFGVARPSLARTMKEMEVEGLITSERKKITIVNLAQLKRLAM